MVGKGSGGQAAAWVEDPGAAGCLARVPCSRYGAGGREGRACACGQHPPELRRDVVKGWAGKLLGGPARPARGAGEGGGGQTGRAVGGRWARAAPQGPGSAAPALLVRLHAERAALRNSPSAAQACGWACWAPLPVSARSCRRASWLHSLHEGDVGIVAGTVGLVWPRQRLQGGHLQPGTAHQLLDQLQGKAAHAGEAG